MIKHSDEELMLAFATDDPQAFEQLYNRYKDSLYRYFVRHLSNVNTSQELAQDLWMKVIKSKSNYRATAKFKSWLYTLAHHTLVDWYRRNNLESSAFDKKPVEDSDAIEHWNPEDELQTKKLSKLLKQSISKLPFEQREIFLMHQEGSFSLPQIAEILDDNVEKIKSRYRYAVNKLRGYLETMR